MTYTVSLQNFSGPLDLLLYLIKQEEVEITEIPIATICDRYLQYMKQLEHLDVDVASEFLVMAASLMLIKSRALLPAEEEVDLEEELDPQDELIQQLLEYKRFKMACRDLNALAEERTRIFPYSPPREPSEQEIPIEDLDLMDLVKAFAVLLRQTGLDGPGPRLIRIEKPLREYVSDVFEILRKRGTATFAELFEGAADRPTVIGRFIALLELVRRKRVRAQQLGSFDRIEVAVLDARDLSDEEMGIMEQDLQALPSEDELDIIAEQGLADEAGPVASEAPRRFPTADELADAALEDERNGTADDDDDELRPQAESASGG